MGKHYPEVQLVYAIRGTKVPRGMKLQEQIVIGHPGAPCWDCSSSSTPKRIKVFVLDEADADDPPRRATWTRASASKRMLPKNCQMLLFLRHFEESCVGTLQAHRAGPQHHQAETGGGDGSTPSSSTTCSATSKEEKFKALCNIYGAITIAQAMIFCHTRRTAGWLAGELSREGHQVALLSGEMQVEQRAAVIDRFRDGKEKVLVTTNVCARGIDVEQVSVVINFDLPVDKDSNPDNETYLHRIGRTGRFGKRGLAINMVDSKFSMDVLNRIQDHF
ncbi:hypothetical protein CRUP_037729, partial [Coryphaenoides rupestris]